MLDFLISGLILVTLLALSFGAGAWYYARRMGQVGRPFADTYYQSLRYVLNEQVDTSLDAFIDSLVVNSDTLEIHLALGSLMRRRGEVSKAIRIHEHLVHNDKLSLAQRHQAQLALGCDFVSAGLLDRAENLFDELVRADTSYTPEALHQLLLIYQNEREWQKAIAVADQLAAYPKELGENELALMKSHYCCELAQRALAAGERQKVRDHLSSATRYYQHSVRASLIYGQLEADEGRYAAALEVLKKIPQQDSELINQSLELVCQCFQNLGDREGLRHYLFGLLARSPGSSLILCLAELLRESEGEQSAIDFLVAQLRLRPSVRALSRLIDLYLPDAEGLARDNLELLRLLVDKVVTEKPAYICQRCGFTGHKLHWLCPSCKTWGSIKPIKGVTGE